MATHSVPGTTPPPNSPYASPSIWTSVQLPHDHTYTSSQSNSSRGQNMPQNVGSSSDGNSKAGIIMAHEEMWRHMKILHNCNGPVRECAICLADCVQGGEDLATTVIELSRCHHQFHLFCVNELLKQNVRPSAQQSMYMRCPMCMTVYGEQRGNQPPGTMNSMLMDAALPGFPNTKTIQITYHILPGIQTKEHPNPGTPFTASNFPRNCYLPDTEKGRLVRDLLRIAFDRRLVFTVGRSLTTGRNNVVTWNEIHHKTEWNNVSGHGYPDDQYLDRCLRQLAGYGITPEILRQTSTSTD